MSPSEKQRLAKLEMVVDSLLRVTSVPFIETLNRRLGSGIIDDNIVSSGTISSSVNEAGVAAYSVAKVPDGKMSIILTDGTIKYIGVYNS